MKFLNFIYQHVNILSLDVVAGSVVSALFFARLMDVALSSNTIVALALTVWIIYTIDHLRDARAIPNVASTDRHRFHQRNFKIMSVILVVMAVTNAVVISTVSREVLTAGLVLGVVVLIYLLFQRHLKFLKEVFVAGLYTAGILLPSLATLNYQVLPVHYLVFAKFFITALMNLLLFSLVDYGEDQVQKQHSFVTWFGPTSTRNGIICLGLLNIFSGVWLWGFDAAVALIFASMNLLLLGVLFLRKILVANNYYRIIGDAVFFIPGFYFL